MGFAIAALGLLAGGPGAGGIIGTDPRHLHWTGAWVFSGVCSFAAGFMTFAVRYSRGERKFMVKI